MTPEQIKARLEDYGVRLTALEASQQVTKTSVDEIKKDTSEIVTLLRDAQAAWRFFEVVGRAAKPLAWISGLAVAAGVFWAQVTGKKP